ncbi:MAG TPA: hypothetical protein VN363_03195, partial [Anaerolineales bacterium]|nr:hypothetical protein [Anaerolineales bacterium]
ARWRLGVELVDLISFRPPFERIPFGWYACDCGHTGFKPGPVEEFTEESLDLDHQVSDCPACCQKYR